MLVGLAARSASGSEARLAGLAVVRFTSLGPAAARSSQSVPACVRKPDNGRTCPCDRHLNVISRPASSEGSRVRVGTKDRRRFQRPQIFQRLFHPLRSRDRRSDEITVELFDVVHLVLELPVVVPENQIGQSL